MTLINEDGYKPLWWEYSKWELHTLDLQAAVASWQESQGVGLSVYFYRTVLAIVLIS